MPPRRLKTAVPFVKGNVNSLGAHDADVPIGRAATNSQSMTSSSDNTINKDLLRSLRTANGRGRQKETLYLDLVHPAGLCAAFYERLGGPVII